MPLYNIEGNHNQTNGCLDGYVSVKNSAECKAAFPGAIWGGEYSSASHPKGCNRHQLKHVYFNTHNTGGNDVAEVLEICSKSLKCPIEFHFYHDWAFMHCSILTSFNT